MKTAHITGGTGCIGRNLVDELLEQHWAVTVLHRKSSDLSRLKGCNVRFQEVELHDLDSVRRSIPGQTDAIFHAAANLSHWSTQAEVEQQWKDNVLATRNLVQVAIEKQVRRLIFTSTWATYPYQDTDEQTAQRIEVPYIRTKRLSELEVYRGIERGLDAVVMQPIIVIGRYDYNNYSQIFTALEAGLLEAKLVLPGRLSFCDARSVADAHRQAFERGVRGEHYVLGGTYTTWLEVYQKIATLVGAKPPTRACPQPLLLTVSYLSVGLCQLFRKKPVLTPDLVKLVKDYPDVPPEEKRKAEEDLNYESASLDAMLLDCCNWLKREGRLQ